ncbi:putative GPI-anchored protein [Mucuna pruriens]|uniref:GPI-anchored protein n=1 Tax=Mucuna pruriens TaxID=157652 RepID=A0A371FCY5_MUCPR|nr:putative GPI-anchored protein [Mucuna pruriens]
MSLPLTLFFLCIFFPCYLCLPDPGSATTILKPILVTPSKPATTIPAFPEQYDVAGCPLTLSDELFDGIKSACGGTKSGGDMELHHSRCCPVLAAWLYSAYSATALGIAGHSHGHATSAYDMMPLLPDDSETCVNELGKALEVRGIELAKPNETCDVVYCFCGIRLHHLTCPDAFSVSQSGELVGDASVRRLEKNCLSSTTNVNGLPGLGGCSKCLNTLYLLNKKPSNSSKAEDRTTKIHNKDCELMGLTWLLAKNRTAYMHTVSGVLRALMLNTDGSYPQSCSLNSDGMPLAVDSSEISDHSSSTNLQPPIYLSLLLLSLLLLPMHFTIKPGPRSIVKALFVVKIEKVLKARIG